MRSASSEQHARDILEYLEKEHEERQILRMESSAVPNAIAAMLLHIHDLTAKRPHIYFDWTEGNPVAHRPSSTSCELRPGTAGSRRPGRRGDVDSAAGLLDDPRRS